MKPREFEPDAPHRSRIAPTSNCHYQVVIPATLTSSEFVLFTPHYPSKSHLTEFCALQGVTRAIIIDIFSKCRHLGWMSENCVGIKAIDPPVVIDMHAVGDTVGDMMTF